MPQTRSLVQVQPPGMIAFFPFSSAPTSWLKCNGAAVSRTSYSDLFSAIGTFYGSGDGSSTFNLPDFRGEFIRAWDNSRGIDLSRTFGSYQASQNQPHNHQMLWTYYDGGGGSGLVDPVSPYNVTVSTETAASTGRTGWGVTFSGVGNTENRPRNFCLLVCIKY